MIRKSGLIDRVEDVVRLKSSEGGLERKILAIAPAKFRNSRPVSKICLELARSDMRNRLIRHPELVYRPPLANLTGS
jgi:hypothetical protein